MWLMVIKYEFHINLNLYKIYASHYIYIKICTVSPYKNVMKNFFWLTILLPVNLVVNKIKTLNWARNFRWHDFDTSYFLVLNILSLCNVYFYIFIIIFFKMAAFNLLLPLNIRTRICLLFLFPSFVGIELNPK